MARITHQALQAAYSALDETELGQKVFSILDLNDLFEHCGFAGLDYTAILGYFEALPAISTGAFRGERSIELFQLEHLMTLVASSSAS